MQRALFTLKFIFIFEFCLVLTTFIMMVENNFSCIKEVRETVRIALPLSYISNEIAGVTDTFESWKRQYNQQLQGIVVSYKNISLASRSGCIVTDKPYVQYHVKATFEVFCPSIGSIVQGKVNRISYDYIGCLVHNTINVTIKRFSSSLDGLSEFIALDHMILFKITCFGYHKKVIKVKGEITEECVNLMKELAPFNTQSIFQDSSSSYFSTAELTENTMCGVKDNDENSESNSESLIAPNYLLQTTNQGIFNVDHLADRTSNDVPSTSHESDSSDEQKTGLEKKSEKLNLHKILTRDSEEEMDVDDPISDLKSPQKKKKHKDKKAKNKIFSVTDSINKSSHSEHYDKSSSKKKKSKKDKTPDDSSSNNASGIKTFNDIKMSLSPKKMKSSLSTSKLYEFLSPEQHAVNSIGNSSSNNFSIDLAVKDLSTDSNYSSPSLKKKSKKSKNKSPKPCLNNVLANDIEEMNVFAAIEPKLEEKLNLDEISASAIQEDPVEMKKKRKSEKKRKRKSSSHKDGLPLKKKKSEDKVSGKSKSKHKKDKSKKTNKGKSKKDKKKSKDKKMKSKKDKLSYKIKPKKDREKKKKVRSGSKKLKNSHKTK